MSCCENICTMKTMRLYWQNHFPFCLFTHPFTHRHTSKATISRYHFEIEILMLCQSVSLAIAVAASYYLAFFWHILLKFSIIHFSVQLIPCPHDCLLILLLVLPASCNPACCFVLSESCNPACLQQNWPTQI